MNPGLLFFLRLVLCLNWLYEGLYLKLIKVDKHHLDVVKGLGEGILSAQQFLWIIGIGETLLAIGILSGLYYRFVSWFQIGLILLMNIIGILFSGAIEAPLGLLITNLPLLCCAYIVGEYGPGKFL
ncbi:DoxX-like family protein [Cytophagaceae bacterium DM2B3-1]|uniref:DoxX-like family protein n=1 Tax=Xanthocytophaga flava TaxID=3048013 RepID=A0ABT7CV68_9BACT|nr:DoxX-like family protein [Xanthocytophaga flavus]MDJ1497671.1 DoxX-like family protein [Xanthocytophaga flavus]